MTLADFHAPETIPEAVAILTERGDAAMVLAGGTDVMVRIHRGMVPATVTTLVSLHRMAALRGVRVDGDELVIGAATTAAELVADPLVAEHAPILATVADRLASPQVRNAATIGGNLVNASPAGDLINPLLLLDAGVVLASAAGSRTVAVDELFTGPGETVLQTGELLAEIRCQIPPPERIFRFVKAGTRPAMECALVNLGVAYREIDGRLREVRIAIGSCAPTPVRAHQAEAALEGRPLTPETIDHAVAAVADDICPIDDVRGTAEYRRALVATFLRRLLTGEYQC